MAKQLRRKKLINWNIQGAIVMRLMGHFLAYNLATLFLLLAVYFAQSALSALADPVVNSAPLSFWVPSSSRSDLYVGHDTVHDLGLNKTYQSHRWTTLPL